MTALRTIPALGRENEVRFVNKCGHSHEGEPKGNWKQLNPKAKRDPASQCKKVQN